MGKKRHRRRHKTVKPAPVRMVRFANTDADAVAIHAFLSRVAAASGALRCPISPEKSMREVWTVVRAFDLVKDGEMPHGFALIAQEGDRMVGTAGFICPQWWYGDEHFFSDRWLFALPDHKWAGPALIADANAVAQDADLPLIINLRSRPKSGTNIVYAASRPPPG